MAKKVIPVALQLYSLRARAAQDFFGVLKEVAAIGYVGVEGAGLHGRKPAEVRKVLDDVGLVMPSAHVPLPTPENLSETVDTAKTLGYGMIVSARGPDQFTTLDSIKAVADVFQKAAELVKPHGLRLLYHNHYWEFHRVEGRIAYDILMELAPSLLGQLDVYWASNFETVSVLDVLARYRNRVPSLHIKDGPLVKGQPHTAVGAGKMDIPACIKAADPKFTEWLVVELDACATDMTAAVRESCRYLTSNKLARGKRQR